MPEDLMRYDQLAQNALRGVVRDALRIVQHTGLPGEHHFYIAFNTRHPGVSIGERLAARYPREMTIVLQHQFWGLTVSDERFEVELSFDNIPEKLIVPFEAVKGFLDPSVQFGLQFETVQAAPAAATAERPKVGAADAAASEDHAGSVADEPAANPPQTDGPKVVSLDAFRKK